MAETILHRLGVECYFGVEGFGNRAVLLGFLGYSGERGLVQVRRVSAQSQSRAGDAKALAVRVQSDARLGTELRGSVAAALQLESECHSETAGVCGGDKLLGVGALLVLEARFERIGGLGERTGIGGEVAAAGAARATPNRFRLTDHVGLLCLHR